MSLPSTALPARYRLYIDESGDHTYNLLDDPSHRYLALLGVWFRQADDYLAFADDLEGLKREMFGLCPDNPVILHRSDIVNRKGAFRRPLRYRRVQSALTRGCWRLLAALA